MNKTFSITKTTPILTIIFLFIFWKLPLSLDYLEMIIATLIVILASFIQFKSKIWASLGFKKSNLNIKNILLIAPLIAIILFGIYYFFLIPIVSYITGQPLNFSGFDSLKGNITYMLIALPFIWISAGFCEEVVWRGYFMKQFIRFFGDGKLSLFINIILFGILFGYLHSYQGITGQIITGIIGSLLAFIFQKCNHNIWLNIAIHGFFDTVALLTLYFGYL